MIDSCPFGRYTMQSRAKAGITCECVCVCLCVCSCVSVPAVTDGTSPLYLLTKVAFQFDTSTDKLLKTALGCVSV